MASINSIEDITPEQRAILTSSDIEKKQAVLSQMSEEFLRTHTKITGTLPGSYKPPANYKVVGVEQDGSPILAPIKGSTAAKPEKTSPSKTEQVSKTMGFIIAKKQLSDIEDLLFERDSTGKIDTSNPNRLNIVASASVPVNPSAVLGAVGAAVGAVTGGVGGSIAGSVAGPVGAALGAIKGRGTGASLGFLGGAHAGSYFDKNEIRGFLPEGRELLQRYELGIQAITRGETGAAMPASEVNNTRTRFQPSALDSPSLVKSKWLAYNDFINGTLKLLEGKKVSELMETKVDETGEVLGQHRKGESYTTWKPGVLDALDAEIIKRAEMGSPDNEERQRSGFTPIAKAEGNTIKEDLQNIHQVMNLLQEQGKPIKQIVDTVATIKTNSELNKQIRSVVSKGRKLGIEDEDILRLIRDVK